MTPHSPIHSYTYTPISKKYKFESDHCASLHLLLLSTFVCCLWTGHTACWSCLHRFSATKSRQSISGLDLQNFFCFHVELAYIKHAIHLFKEKKMFWCVIIKTQMQQMCNKKKPDGMKAQHCPN